MTPYWLAEAGPPLAAVSLDRDPDVVVVGGGITGCSAALHLARAGLRVRLHEAREIAGGASGRNGGFALRGGAAPFDVTAGSIGWEQAADLWRLTERTLDELAALGGDAVRRTGSLRVAADEEERDAVHAEYEALRDLGFAVEWREPLGGSLEGRFPAALYHPPDAALQPARLVRRLAVQAATAGVDIREHSRVESLDDLGSPTVVVATDGYPSGLLGAFEGLIVPTRGQVLATEPLPERLFDMPHYGRHGFDYWQQTTDGRLVAGGFRDVSFSSEFTADEATTPEIQTALEHLVLTLAGRALRIEHRWAGIFGLVLDFLPVVGELPGHDGLWVAGGYSGHGNVLGFACGRLVARAILGDRDPLLDVLDPVRLVG